MSCFEFPAVFLRPHTIVVFISSLIGQPCCDSLHRMLSSSWCICSFDGASLWTGQPCGDSLPRMPLSTWGACLSYGERQCFPFSFCRLACPCQCLGLPLVLAWLPLPGYTTVWFTAFCLSLVMLSSLSGHPLFCVSLVGLVVGIHPVLVAATCTSLALLCMVPVRVCFVHWVLPPQPRFLGASRCLTALSAAAVCTAISGDTW